MKKFNLIYEYDDNDEGDRFRISQFQCPEIDKMLILERRLMLEFRYLWAQQFGSDIILEFGLQPNSLYKVPQENEDYLNLFRLLIF